MRERSAAASNSRQDDLGRVEYLGAEVLDQWQSDGEYRAAAVRSIVGYGRTAVKLGHQPHDVQAEAEVRLVVSVLALLEQRLEQAPVQSRRNGRPVVLNLQQVAAQCTFQAHGDDAGGGAEIDGIFDELVEQLHQQVGRAANETRIGGRLEGDMRLRKAAAIGGDGRRQ